MASKVVKYGAAAGVGAVGGAALTNTGFIKEAGRVFLQVLDKHGFEVTIAAFLLLATVFLVWFLLNKLIESKDGEIERLVKLRNELWDEHIKDRPQSGHRPKGKS